MSDILSADIWPIGGALLGGTAFAGGTVPWYDEARWRDSVGSVSGKLEFPAKENRSYHPEKW
jgi:hypothetical protein